MQNDIDGFLKEVIDMMDKIKEVLNQRIDNHAVHFEAYYNTFVDRVNDFLQKSISLIQKYMQLMQLGADARLPQHEAEHAR